MTTYTGDRQGANATWRCINRVVITRETFRGDPGVKGRGAFCCECRIPSSGDWKTQWFPKGWIRDAQQYFQGYQGPIEVSHTWIELQGLHHLIEPFFQKATNGFPGNRDILDINQLLPTAHQTFRSLAKKNHPDHSPVTAEAMKDLNQLWQAVVHDVRANLGAH